MSAVTLPQLLGADPEAFRRCARGWQALAEDLDNAAEEFLRGTRDLTEVWPSGPAADAAQEKVTQLKAEVCNAYQPARRIYEALRHHGDAVEDLRDQARGLIDAAQRSGFSVDTTTLQVSAPARAYQGGSLDYTVRAVQSYADQLASLVERARGLDDATATALAVNLPEDPTGFGTESPPALSRQDVLGERGRDPREVNAWWVSLTPQQQEQAIADFPELVGWLDGVPASDRDTANRITLARLDTDLQRREDEIRARIAELQRTPGDGTLADQMRIGAELSRLNTELTHIDATQVALVKTHQALDKLGGAGLLLGIDTAGDGKAVIAVGNPDTARHTAVWVPGLGTTLDSTRGNVDRVLHLQEAAETITGVPGSVSTVMWLGYDAPEMDLSVVTSERSRAGAPPLLSFVDGLHATHADGPNHVTAIGHSYGSTVVGEAALSGRLHVDDIVTAGSPGTHADKATQLLPDARHVWAGSAADDPVSQTSNVTRWTNLIPIAGPWISYGYDQGHGISPHEADFGANRYVVDTSGHNDYWNPGSRSIQNQASIVVGEYSKAALDHGQAPPDIP